MFLMISNTSKRLQVTKESMYQILRSFKSYMKLKDTRTAFQVRDGNSELSPEIARYCGQTPPPVVTSSGNDLWIKFHSDPAQTGSGFRAKYTVACGGIYTGMYVAYLCPVDLDVPGPEGVVKVPPKEVVGTT